jgi:putative nucleotidyltransferase with HDIG domain
MPKKISNHSIAIARPCNSWLCNNPTVKHSPTVFPFSGRGFIFAAMEINCTDRELFIFKKIAHAAEELAVDCYAIGGFVRDKILGRDTKDIDIVCIGDGILLAEKVAERFSPRPQVNFFKNFGTAHIRLDDVELEFVGARKESYTYDSRKPEVTPGSLGDDQDRRDFTINALAISLNKQNYGKLLDPFGGLQHLQQKLIVTPLDPDKTFSDDPLRMLRAIRFSAQLDFSIAEETLSSIASNAERIRIISKERIADELNKILLCPKPSVGFDLLYKTGLLNIIFPQMVALAGAEYIDGKGHKDNFYHTLQVLDNIARNTDDLWLRWAAVLHDIAKPVTKKFEEGHGWTFHGHEVVGGRMVPKIFTQLKLPMNEKMLFVRKMVELHLRPISLTKENITDSAIRRLLFDAGEDFESLMTLCKADITSKNKQKVQRYLDNFEMVQQRCAELEASDHIRNWQPPITGEIIMETFNLPPSKPVGIIKDAIRNAILDGEIANTYDAAFEFMLEKAKELGILKVTG